MVDLPNDGANKGFWRVQLRDRFGKFVEMGGAVSFEVQLPGVTGISRGLGYFIGNKSLDLARISVKDNLSVPQGIYEIAPDKITAIQAIIRRDQLVENPDGSVFARSIKATPTEPLRDSMSGAEVQKKKLKSITTTLKRKGRFAVPRQSNLDTWGKTSDVSVAAQADYKQVYDASPELQKLYDNAEDMWFRVFSLSVSTDTSSPNDLSEIPEEMKLLNREYAKHFLGLKEDGLITVYRNAVNGKDNQIDAAAGYVSTDMSLSYDYNSKKENIGANGRYEIDVKPDEVFGMLGYSQPEDEYAFVVGKGVTSQEGRVRRVGDLASLPMPAPWLDQYAKDISYARGATPYRHHALAGQFNFHEVENFGNDLKEFFAKYNLTADNIKSTFDRLYGSGAYEEYRESGNIVSFDGIRKMFVGLPSGKIGLDITKISGGSSQGITFHSYGDASKPESYKNDRLDNTLKMLAVFQELTGEPFFTHRSRDYVPTGDTKLVAPEIEPEISSPEIEDSEREALKWYTDGGYWNANKNLRDGEPLDDDDSKELKTLLDLINKKTITQGRTLYRGRPVINEERLAAINALKPGDFITDRGIMSTSSNKDRAKFYAQMDLEKVKGRVMFEIDVEAGQKGFEVPDEYSSYGDSEAEVLFPPNSRLEVIEVITPDDGMKTIKLKVVESAATAEEKKTGLFQEYVPENRTDPGRSNAAEDTPLTELGFDPEQEIEVYRGVPEDVDSINPGDWVTTLPQLAKDYAGTGKVISKKVKAKDLLADPSSGEDAYTEEMVYNPFVVKDADSIAKEISSKSDLGGWKQTGTQKGSNIGGTYEDLEGNSYYVKTARSELHGQNEVLASAFYELAGIKSARMRLGLSEDKTLKVFSRIIPNSTADLKDKLADPEYKKKLQDGFAIDAWLANWDVAGSAYDNVVTDGSGSPVRVDPGGSLMFRARGEPKLDAFGNEVKELDSLRNSSVNPVSASVFGDMTEDQLKDSAAKLLKISEADIEKLVDAIVTDPDAAKELKNKLISRRKFILNKYNLSEPQDSSNSSVDSIGAQVAAKDIIKIWDSVLNERGAYEFDEDAADSELYDLMLQEGVSSKELAMANPVYRDYLKTLEFRKEEDSSDHREWALDFLKNVRRSWNGNPKLSGLILAMQPVAEKVYGLQGTSNPIQELSSATKKEIADYTKFSKPALEAFLKASYKSTQKFFKDRGIETLVVYRGVINSSDNSYLTDPTEISVDVRPMSSWTADPEIAKAYAPPGGILLRAEIPISQVLSTAFSGGMGTYVEREVVLLGAPEKIMGVVGSEYRKLLPGVQTTAKDTDIPGVIDVVDGVQRLQGEQSIFDGALTADKFDIAKLNGSRQTAEDLEMFSKEELETLRLYTGSVAYKIWNRDLRKNNAIELSKIKTEIDQLDAAIKDHGEVFEDSVVYRGTTFQSVPEQGRTNWASILENLKVGDILSDEGYMSTSNNPKVAYGTFAGNSIAEEDGFRGELFEVRGTYITNLDSPNNSLLWVINLPKGSTAMALPENIGFGQGAEEEVILPRGSRLRVKAIRRVEKEGEKGRYNYFLETEFIGADPVEIQLVEAPEGEGIPNVEG